MGISYFDAPAADLDEALVHLQQYDEGYKNVKELRDFVAEFESDKELRAILAKLNSDIENK